MMITEQIKKEIRDFTETPIRITKGYDFNQIETIQTIIAYYHSRFRNGQFYTDEDYKDQRKFFHNIVIPPCDNATKNLDIDIKDIYPTAKKEEDYVRVEIFREDLFRYMKKHKIGQLQDKIAIQAPIFGTVVLKEVPTDNIVELVDLRNLICDPTADKLENTFVIERHFYTPDELKKMPWDNIDLVIQNYTEFQKKYEKQEKKTPNPFIEVYERYGEVPLSWYKEARGEEIKEGDDKKYILARFILTGLYSGKTDNKSVVILDASEIAYIPYKEWHYIPAIGRWLGVGEVERAFDPQIRINELTNYKIQGMRLSTLHIFVTPDTILQKNVLKDCDNGDILTAPNGIQPLGNEERNLAAYAQEEKRIDELVAANSSSYEVVRGDTMPAGTPFRSVAVQNINAAKIFDFRRKSLALFLKEVYREWVFPRLMKKLNEEHILDMSENSEIYKKFLDDVVRYRTWQAIKKMIVKGIRFSWGQLDLIRSTIKEKLLTQKIKIPRGYYNGFEYEIDMNIAGEKYNKAAVLESKFNLVKLLGGQNGLALLQNPVSRRLIEQIAELSGTSPLEITEGSATNQQAQVGALIRQMGMPGEATAR